MLFIAQTEVKTHSIRLNFNSWPGGGLAASGGLQQHYSQWGWLKYCPEVSNWCGRR